MDEDEDDESLCDRCGEPTEDEDLDEELVCPGCNEADREAAERLSDYRFMCR